MCKVSKAVESCPIRALTTPTRHFERTIHSSKKRPDNELLPKPYSRLLLFWASLCSDILTIGCQAMWLVKKVQVTDFWSIAGDPLMKYLPNQAVTSLLYWSLEHCYSKSKCTILYSTCPIMNERFHGTWEDKVKLKKQCIIWKTMYDQYETCNFDDFGWNLLNFECCLFFGFHFSSRKLWKHWC